MKDDQQSGDWEPAARCSELEIVVMSLQAARLVPGIQIHPQAGLVSLILPEGGDAFAIGHADVDMALAYIEQMRPHTVKVLVAPGEDGARLRRLLNVHGANESGPRAEEIFDALIARVGGKDRP